MATITLKPEIKQHLIILGIMGGICSGKSTVSQMLEQLGACRLDADQIANQSLQLPDVQQQIITWWGQDMMEAGQIQRKKLAKVVFENPLALKQLEGLLHPLVRKTIQEQLIQLSILAATAQHKTAVILDIPLLWESGWHDVCDYLIFVEASLEVRQQRAISQRNWAAQDVLQREQHQASLAQKQSSAHFIIPNHGDIKITQEKVQELWKKIFK